MQEEKGCAESPILPPSDVGVSWNNRASLVTLSRAVSKGSDKRGYISQGAGVRSRGMRDKR
jgi:hypothetical protein